MFTLSVCGIPLEIHGASERCRQLCAAFIVPDKPDAQRIVITDADIGEEVRRWPQPAGDRASGEFTLLCRKVQKALLPRDCLLIHSVALDIAGEGYLLLGKSGIGKTTLGRHCQRMLPGARIINGDKPMVLIDGGRILAYGTPWCGKENLCVNDHVAVRHLVFLRQAAANSRRPLNRKESFYRLIHQIPYPETEPEVKAYAALVEAVLTHCVASEYGCVNAPCAAVDLVKAWPEANPA
ncbi:MAG: hypothetical protein GX418_07220 [Clostridiales bacterium]|nr:hypothetical protein [Clostridiales bacterium]